MGTKLFDLSGKVAVVTCNRRYWVTRNPLL